MPRPTSRSGQRRAWPSPAPSQAGFAAARAGLPLQNSNVGSVQAPGIVLDPPDGGGAGFPQGLADLFHPSEHAQEVQRGHLLQIALRETAPHQFREQVGKAASHSRGPRGPRRQNSPSRSPRDRTPASSTSFTIWSATSAMLDLGAAPCFVSSSASWLFGSAAIGGLAVTVASPSQPVAQRLREETRHESRHHDAAIGP